MATSPFPQARRVLAGLGLRIFTAEHADMPLRKPSGVLGEGKGDYLLCSNSGSLKAKHSHLAILSPPASLTENGARGAKSGRTQRASSKWSFSPSNDPGRGPKIRVVIAGKSLLARCALDLGNPAVFHLEHPVGLPGQLRVVGNHDHGEAYPFIKLLQDLHNLS